MSEEEIAEREKLAIESLQVLKLSAAVFELGKFLSQNRIPINRDGTGLLVFLENTVAEDPSIIGEMKNSFLEALRDADGEVVVNSDWKSISRVLAR